MQTHTEEVTSDGYHRLIRKKPLESPEQQLQQLTESFLFV